MTEAKVDAEPTPEERKHAPKVFLHLTKTAGGTLKTALKRTSDLQTYFVYGAEDMDRLKEEEPGQYGLIYGHSTFGVHREVGLAEDTRYLCFMRHPITRTISHYYHLRNVDKGPVGDRIRASSDINDFFANHNHWEFSDFMTKVISGVGNKQPTKDMNIFRMAVDNLDNRFDFVGFQEFFPISIRSLSQFLGTKVSTKKDINIGRYSLSDIGPKTIDRIERLNQQDIRLYKYALRKFL